MIDTIHFRILNLSYHNKLVYYLLEESKLNSTVKEYTVDEETGEMLYKDARKFSYVQYFDTGNASVKRAFGSLPSHHYDIAFCVDQKRDFVDVNVSLPKYYHGTNVFQLVPHLFDADYYKYLSADPISNIFKDAFALFDRLFRGFIDRRFPDTLHDLVSIVRLDFCYNQVFLTEQDALTYLQNIQTKRKQYQRDRVNQAVNYDSSLQYVTADYSFKVYHKGTEFRKHDKKQLLAFNKKLKKNYFDIGAIDELAGRTLRYELTSRLANLNYIYKFKYLFKEGAMQFVYSDWLQFKRYPERLKPLSVQRKMEVKKHIKSIDKIISKTYPLVISNKVQDPKVILLDRDLFAFYLQYFWDMVKSYQLEHARGKVFDLNDILTSQTWEESLKIKGGYKRLTHKRALLTRDKLLKINFYLRQGMTLDEVRKEPGLIAKSTYYDILKILKRFGIDKNSHFGIAIKSTIDFRAYYEFCMFKNSQFSNLKMYPV